MKKTTWTSRELPRYFNISAITVDGSTYSTQLWMENKAAAFEAFVGIIRSRNNDWDKPFLVATLLDTQDKALELFDAARLAHVRETGEFGS